MNDVIYPKLHAMGLVATKREFSEKWLDRCGRYLIVTAYEPATVKSLKVILLKLRNRGLYDLAGIVQKEIIEG